ncbi:MAG: PAS domain S-box protein [Deltaproteobacteria bacterium]|nr:PAS domain S-box protein [Deltaproteobacteria bacterium]
MKSYSIDIDDKIWNYLKDNAEPFEDTPNSVLCRLLFDTGIPVGRDKKFDDMMAGIPGVTKKPPQALSQVLEVIFEMKMTGRSRIAATGIVARRRGRAPQTIIDKYCRQLGKKASEIDGLLEEDNLQQIELLLRNKFKTHTDRIGSFFDLLKSNDQSAAYGLNQGDTGIGNNSSETSTDDRNNAYHREPVALEIPTYNELTQQVDQLKETVSESRDSETKFKTLFENANDLIVFINREGFVHEINDKCESFFNLTREEMIGKRFSQFGEFFSEKMQDLVDTFNETFTAGKPLKMHEQTIRRRDGSFVHVEMNGNFVERDGKKIGIFAVIRDITDRKQAEEKLLRYRDRLAELVKDRTAELEKSNSALKIMLQKENEVRKEFEEKLLFNVKELIVPNLERLSRSNLNDRQKDYLNIIESNLDEIISSFFHNMSSRYFSLTPTELQIANLIMHGKGTKDIAEFLNLSINTIQFHRANIRKKMRISNKKVNLRTFLQSLQK